MTLAEGAQGTQHTNSAAALQLRHIERAVAEKGSQCKGVSVKHRDAMCPSKPEVAVGSHYQGKACAPASMAVRLR